MHLVHAATLIFQQSVHKLKGAGPPTGMQEYMGVHSTPYIPKSAENNTVISLQTKLTLPPHQTDHF